MKIWFATAAVLSASPALAQMAVPQDVADGMYVTVAEVRANAAAVYSSFAGPGGGPISRQTFTSRDLPAGVVPGTSDQQLLSKLFQKLDANGDGQLTRSEWNQRIEADLAFADGNGDGRVTLKELANARSNMSFGETLGMIF